MPIDAFNIKKLVESYADHVGTNKQGAVRDLVTDVIHYCKKNNISFSTVLAGAREVAREERMENEP